MLPEDIILDVLLNKGFSKNCIYHCDICYIKSLCLNRQRIDFDTDNFFKYTAAQQYVINHHNDFLEYLL